MEATRSRVGVGRRVSADRVDGRRASPDVALDSARAPARGVATDGTSVDGHDPRGCSPRSRRAPGGGARSGSSAGRSVGPPGSRSSSASGIVLALACRAVDFLSEVELGALWSRQLASRGRAIRYLVSLFVGSFVVSMIAMVVAAPLGLGRGDVPLGVREPARSADPEADPRDPRGHPERRDRVLRPHGDQPGRSCSASSAATNSSTMMAAGIGVGILRSPLVASVAEDAMYRRPATRCARRPTGSVPATDRHASASCSRQRSRASSPP